MLNPAACGRLGALADRPASQSEAASRPPLVAERSPNAPAPSLPLQQFLSLRRLGLLRRPPEGAPPALDLSFLIDHVMHSVHPLDWDAVLASPLPLKVGWCGVGVGVVEVFWGGGRASGLPIGLGTNQQAAAGSATGRCMCQWATADSSLLTAHPPMHPPTLPQVVASSLDTLDSILLSNFRSKDDLVSCLKASAAVPEVAGGPVEHR